MRRRLLASYLGLTLLLLVVLEVPLAVNHRARLEAQLTADLERDAFAIAAFAEDTLEGTAARDLQVLADGYAGDTGARVVVVDAAGAAVADSGRDDAGEDFTNRDEVATALSGQVAAGTRYSATLGEDLLYVAVPVASGRVFGAVRLSYATTQLNEQVRRYWLTLAGVAAVSLGAAAAVGVLLSRWVTAPLDRLRTAAGAIGAGDLDARAPSGAGPPEVRELTTAFNRTADRLQELLASQDAFVADASHQLRTPLTGLRLRLENLVEDCRPGGDGTGAVVEDLEACLVEVDRLSRLVDGLLALARTERDSAGARPGPPVAVGPLLEGRRAAWDEVAAERSVVLSTGPVEPADLRVAAAEERAVQVLDNLLANALDVSPVGGAVELAAEEADGVIRLHVLDRGPGLADAERDRAFDRFWTRPADRARAGRDRLGGNGLGLPIARRLARADGGDVVLAERAGGGLDAAVQYPRARAEGQGSSPLARPGPRSYGRIERDRGPTREVSDDRDHQ